MAVTGTSQIHVVVKKKRCHIIFRVIGLNNKFVVSDWRKRKKCDSIVSLPERSVNYNPHI
jgi:hypothetical protein